MERNLGPTYARSWAHDVVLTDLGGLTVDEALATQLDDQDVWRAVAAQPRAPGARAMNLVLRSPRCW